jgi:hypothetical protein
LTCFYAVNLRRNVHRSLLRREHVRIYSQQGGEDWQILEG